MNRLLSRPLSRLWPGNERSAEASSRLQAHRGVTFAGLVLALISTAVFLFSPTAGAIVTWGPLGIAGLFGGLLWLSFTSDHVRRHYVGWTWGLLCVVLAWATVVAALNQFGGDYAVGLLITYAVLSAILGIGAQSIFPVLLFTGGGIVATAAGLAGTSASETSPVVILVSMATVALTETLIIRRRLSTRKELRRREGRLRSITENVSDGIYRSTPEEGIVYANQAFAEMFGYTDVESLLKDDPATLYKDPSVRERLRALAKEQGHFDTVEVELRRKDGTTFPAFLSGTLVRDEEGNVMYYDGVVTDVTEQRQRQREVQRRSDAMEAATDGIAILDDDGRFTYANQAHADIYGYEAPEPLLGTTWRLFYSEQELRRFDREIMPALYEQGEWRGEATGLRADGSTFPEELTLTLLDDGGIVSIVRDITEQKEAERVLADRQDKVESLYAATSHLLTTGMIEEVADRIQEVLSDVFNFPVTAVNLEEEESLVPKRAAVEETHDMPVVKSLDVGGESVAAQAYRRQETVVFEDVQTLDNGHHYGDLGSAAGVPMGEHGAIVLGRLESGHFGAFDLRLVEILAAHATVVLDGLEQLDALRQSEQRFRRIFENAAIGVALVDDRGYLLEVNPALREMTGYEAAELEDTHFSKITHPDDVEADLQYYQELTNGERDRYQMQKRYVRKDGDVFWARLTVSRHGGDEDGRYVGMVEDIDDRKRYEERLKEAKEEAERMNRLKSAFLANMSHEIRTPLTSIIGFAEAIGDEISGLEESLQGDEYETLHRFSELIERGGHRLMETLDSVLNLSKLEAGEMDLSPGPIDLAMEVRDAAELYECQAEEAGLAYHVEVANEPLRGRADEGGLRIALRNLLSNAIKYTSEGGDVWVRVRRDEGTAVIEIEDTGVGMDPQRLPELFQAFKQESEGVSREYEGSGLGLAVTKRVIDQMGGAVDVETAKGEGTCFSIRLPVVEVEVAMEE